MVVRLSVIVCTHNPDLARIARVLESLKVQTLAHHHWELIVVDNDSNPPLDGRVDLSWHPASRMVREPQLGLTQARLRGVEEAVGDILLYVDDDMVPAPDYFERALAIYEKYPFIGALGGFGMGEFGAPLEPWMEDFRNFLLDFSKDEGRQMELQYAMTRLVGPWVPIGAGMSVRRQVAMKYRDVVREDEFRKALDRRGSSLCGSGDADLAYTAIDCGYACASSSLLKFTHIIPAHRMTLGYMKKLLYTSQYFTAQLLVYRGWKKKGISGPASAGFRRFKDLLLDMKKRSPRDQCWRAMARGYHDGIIGAPLDKRYAG